jgi:regulator of protease activity HflC (stomatin/prohibitin superfamily)
MKKFLFLGIGLPATLAAGVYAWESIYRVEPGHRAVIFDRLAGVQSEVVGEGLHFKTPFIQLPIMFDVRCKVYSAESMAFLEGGEEVQVGVRVLYLPQIAELPTIFKNYGQDYGRRIVPAMVDEIVSIVSKQYTTSNVDQFVRKKHVMEEQMKDLMSQRLGQFGLDLVDLSIKEIRV